MATNVHGRMHRPTMKDVTGSPQAADVGDAAFSVANAQVLIVSNQSVEAQLLLEMLATQGCQISQAINEKTALQAIQQEFPDAIFLSVDLPTANSYEVCRTLKKDTKLRDVPIIFTATTQQDCNGHHVFQAGGADYIKYPFDSDEVIARLSHQLVLHQRQANLHQLVDTLQTQVQTLDAQNQDLQEQTGRSLFQHPDYEHYLQERQAVEATLRETEEKYRSIFENAIEGIFQSLPDRRYLRVNPAMAKIYGYDSPADLLESVTDMSTLYVQPKRYAELRAFIQIYDEVSDFESQVYRRDGSVIWVSENIRTVRNGAGDVLYYEGSVTDITERRQAEEELRRQRLKAERLLLNVLPQKIAERLKRGQKSIADTFSEVSVLFADLVSFTQLSSEMPASDLVTLLNKIFSSFDQLVERYNIEKVKTIGDSYMAVAGMPTYNPRHAEAIANLALDMQDIIQQFSTPGGKPFQLRIGIHTGSVIAGVIGTKKFSYDLWGDTVNVASRMESQGEAGRIQVTESIYTLLRDRYLFTPRGSILVKGKGSMETYWLEGRRPSPNK